MSYLDRLKSLDEKYSPIEATAKTAKIDLRSFCSRPIEKKRSIPAEVEPAGEDTPSGVSWRWLLHFPDREPLTVTFSPAATHVAVLDAYPAALAAEPIEPGRQLPDTLLAGDQEAAVLAWLSEIGENDQATIDDMLRQCRQDEEARRYFLGRAVEISADDDRRCCSQCLNLRSGVCVVAKPGGVGSAIRGYRPALGILQH
ncbi:MAG: hypothetical protein NFW16_14535 [Candidatus Accumulibacter sp.]|uniref:hypothetical protein n=1 Tax=Accumulibacter sp. TaxID=2053492 RepID=UPI0025829CAC|nr:hypothetical protein [Accumulibacter sp.]MCM8622911.1 hypothetical protein [Accumulibacter sp.]